VHALALGIAHSRLFTKIELRNTKLSDKFAIQLLNAMNAKILRHLDFSLNPTLTSKFYEHLSQIASNPDSKLEVLELEGVKLSDVNLERICKWLPECLNIRVLNFSKNEITDKGIPAICVMMQECTALKGLFLHYNRIMMKGGILMAQAIRENRYLEVFDISFNAIGGGILMRDQKQVQKLKTECATAWNNAFKYN